MTDENQRECLAETLRPHGITIIRCQHCGEIVASSNFYWYGAGNGNSRRRLCRLDFGPGGMVLRLYGSGNYEEARRVRVGDVGEIYRYAAEIAGATGLGMYRALALAAVLALVVGAWLRGSEAVLRGLGGGGDGCRTVRGKLVVHGRYAGCWGCVRAGRFTRCIQIKYAGLATMGDGQILPISDNIFENTDEDICVGFELLR